MSLYTFSVKHNKEYLLREWDTVKNAPLTPESAASTSTARVWWKCEKEHSWQTQISSRSKGNSGCPICLREKINVRMEKRRAAEAEKSKVVIKTDTGGKE